MDSEADDALIRALRRAIESGDTDLVMAVLFAAYRTRPPAAFWQLVSSKALARNLFVKYCKARVRGGGVCGCVCSVWVWVDGWVVGGGGLELVP